MPAEHQLSLTNLPVSTGVINYNWKQMAGWTKRQAYVIAQINHQKIRHQKIRQQTSFQTFGYIYP